jgi:hypothetical protein
VSCSFAEEEIKVEKPKQPVKDALVLFLLLYGKKYARKLNGFSENFSLPFTFELR